MPNVPTEFVRNLRNLFPDLPLDDVLGAVQEVVQSLQDAVGRGEATQEEVIEEMGRYIRGDHREGPVHFAMARLTLFLTIAQFKHSRGDPGSLPPALPQG